MRELRVDAAGESHCFRLTDQHRGRPLTDLLRFHRLPLNTRCGQRGACDGCLLSLLSGELIRTGGTGAPLRANGRPLSVRGCEYQIHPGSDIVHLEIPKRSLLAYEPQVAMDFRINVPAGRNPLCADLRRPLGVAIDVGTTTVALMLVNLEEGTILSRAAEFNQQMNLGDDVVTRINLCGTDPSMVRRLQEAVLAQTIEPLVVEALVSAGRDASDIGCFAIAGNTIMLHLLAGEDPSPMGTAPFTPVFTEYRQFVGNSLPLAIARHATIHLLPSAAAYIGADLSAGVLASGLVYDDGPSLLVDLGTNGEIILKHRGKMLGCATAAGPAFEGARLEFGMRAGSGAIAHVRLRQDPFRVDVEVIGDAETSGHLKPAGLCGSAYVDLLAEGRRAGLLSPAGRFRTAELPGVETSWIERRADRSAALRVAYGQGKESIVVSELDISRLLQAKAAIAAGILTLLGRAGIPVGDVNTLYLAGGFGMHVDAANAIACGLLPGFAPRQIQVVGNTSLAGAYLSLLDASAVDELSRIARKIDVVELNLDPEFENQFIDQLCLP